MEMTDDSDKHTSKNATTVSKMASDRDDAVLLGLLVKKINDYEPNLVEEIQTIVDTVFKVANCEVAETNGYYRQDGTCNGKPKYAHMQGNSCMVNTQSLIMCLWTCACMYIYIYI